MANQRAWRVKSLQVIVSILSLVGALSASVGVAQASEGPFCTGNRGANEHCYGTKEYVQTAVVSSTNGGWSWSWVWNETWGSNAEACRSGDCEADAQVGGPGNGEEEMENISGKTYYYTPSWYSYAI